MAERPPNPFSVFTPEGLDARTVVAIFSTLMPGLDILQASGHAFVSGARGSGKSILFRYLEPDCQSLVTSRDAASLSHFAFYVSFRETEAHISELARFEDQHGAVFFNEHLLVLSIAARIVNRLIRHGLATDTIISSAIVSASERILSLLGLTFNIQRNSDTASGVLNQLSEGLQEAYRFAISYIRKHSFRSEIIPYPGELLGFEDFLLPFISILRRTLNLPPSQRTFLLLDDADSLTEIQTRIINSWVARRLSIDCSLKIAAQVTAYKTTLTSFNTRIEAPHDYQEISLTEINSRSGEANYRNRIASIVSQRLKAVGVQTWPDKFFAEDHRQAVEIERESDRLRKAWNQGEGRGHRARDDIQRYARPEYIRKLGGSRKSRNKYSYSGFDQLVHVSSGVPRFFLEAAAAMYERAILNEPPSHSTIDQISPAIQNEVVRDQAQRQFIWDIRDLRRDVERLYGTPQRAVKLHNLINGLGILFEIAMIDEQASERKYFSFAFSDTPDLEVEEVLELGLRYGYLFRSVIGRKEGLGRTPLYILSRRLAPLFNLDPMGFAAYKFMTNASVKELMDDPERARRALRRRKFFEGETGQSLLPFEGRGIRDADF